MEAEMKIGIDTADEKGNETKALVKKKNESSHISVKEFLNYLKTAYQLQDNESGGDGILMSGGMKDAVDWLKSKENQELLRINSICCQTSDTLLQEDAKVNADR
ncbi:unnamed protein product [Acanthoscelides obtectus]|uniref:Uncharacterized protein n=1 Tax=Acanthoscelides obtectus TaxID=200917 RepID=A0A9P0PF76_ACAOB|nr:unnamed protein product [Acanthoscelides obtectus]CAK1659074.1 hypothetical protein AOBTE_LOCUS21266 [Acanthoscelides obtectus]